MDHERLKSACADMPCSVAVRRGGESWKEAFGGLATDDELPIYSLTKTYLAVLALRLVEEGRLSLDACRRRDELS